MAAALPAIAIGSSIASGVLGYMGAQQSASAQAAAANYQAQVAQNNALINQRNAQTEYAVGEEKAMVSGIAGRQRIGQIRAAQGASGVQVGTGTSADVVTGQKQEEQISEGIIREGAGRKAYDYQVQAYGDVAQAGLDTMAAQSALEAGEIKGITSLIGGATSVSDKWMQASKLGMLGG